MAGTIEVAGVRASFDGHAWDSANQSLEDLLNAAKPEHVGSDPDYTYTVVAAAAALVNGSIVHVDDVADLPEDAIP